MADVSNSGQFDRNRGQLILVTGLAVAVTLVAVVLLLNTVIYTQNLATRGTGIDDGEAVSFRGEVVDGVGTVVDGENREEYEERANLVENVTDGVVRFDATLSGYHAERGTVADVEERTLSFTEGMLLRQTDAARNFTAANDEPVDWTLATDVANARRLRLNVSDDELVGSDSSPFSVAVDDGSDETSVAVYEDADGDIAVTNDTDESPPDSCTVSGATATVDLTAGTVDGTACPELAGLFDAEPYDITFRNPERVTGTYEVTADTSTSEVDVKTANFADAGSEESPRAVAAVYAAEFGIRFRSPDLTFRTTLRVAGGEPS